MVNRRDRITRRVRRGSLLWWGWHGTEALAWAAGLAIWIVLALAAGPHAGGGR